MRRALLRRGARALVDDALDRLRTGVASVVMLHVLPSLPALGAALWWCVDLDLRGAMPSAGGALLVLLVVHVIHALVYSSGFANLVTG